MYYLFGWVVLHCVGSSHRVSQINTLYISRSSRKFAISDTLKFNRVKLQFSLELSKQTKTFFVAVQSFCDGPPTKSSNCFVNFCLHFIFLITISRLSFFTSFTSKLIITNFRTSIIKINSQ